MCGIAGIRWFDGRDVDAAMLQRMAGTLSHRGPDGDGFLVRGSVGFAHRRLSIIDLEQSHQPMTSVDGFALSQYLGRRSARHPRTLFDGIRKVGPGHVLRVGARGIEGERSYWSIPSRSGTDISSPVDALETALSVAVERNLVADVPV